MEESKTRRVPTATRPVTDDPKATHCRSRLVLSWNDLFQLRDCRSVFVSKLLDAIRRRLHRLNGLDALPATPDISPCLRGRAAFVCNSKVHRRRVRFGKVVGVEARALDRRPQVVACVREGVMGWIGQLRAGCQCKIPVEWVWAGWARGLVRG